MEQLPPSPFHVLYIVDPATLMVIKSNGKPIH
jgi:hypothetical protein